MNDSWNGGIAQLGEHLPCKQGVKGSNPFISIRREPRQGQRENIHTSVKREPQDLRSFGHCLSDNVFRKNRILTNASIRRILFSEKSLSSIVHWKLHIRNIKTSEVILKKNKLERNKPEIETMKNCKISKRPTKRMPRKVTLYRKWVSACENRQNGQANKSVGWMPWH